MRSMLYVFMAVWALLGWGVSDAMAAGKPLVIEAIEVEAKIKKPEIPIFMNRENLNTDYKLELKESFLPKIVESVEKRPF